MLSRHRVPTVLALALSFAPQGSEPGPLDCVVPASPHPVPVVQPDGSALSLHFRGDGLNAWYEDAAGYPVVERDGWYVYARRDAAGRLQATDLRVGRAAPQDAGLEAHVRPRPSDEAARLRRPAGKPSAGGTSNAFLGSASVKNLVVLLRFSDHGPGGQNRTLPSAADVDVIMNAPGGDPTLAPTGSVNDHYQEMSYGQFSIESTVADWVTVPHSEVYYANGNSGLTSLTWDLITDGLELVDPAVDFGDFDEDGDGFIDAIAFLHSGYGAEWGGTDTYGRYYTDRMWSHKWGIPTWTSDEGVKVSAYHISPALWATSGSNPGRIGVVSHESGHFFGLPDLYDTDGTSEGDGNWCLMAAGSWGFDGSQRHPSHFSPWSKSKLGWIDPVRILPGAHVAPRIETSPTAFLIDNGYPPGEYLMIENRQKTGFDAVIPQGGLAIWHVDEAKGGLGSNHPNGDEGYPGQSGWPGNGNHYRNALLQADDDWDLEHGDNRGDGGDIYHGGGVTVLDGGTSPGTNAYQEGTILSSGNRIDSIGSSSANVPFTYTNALAPSITSGAPPAGMPGVPYSFSLTAAGGTTPRTWWETIADPTYTQQDLGSSLFTTGGTAQGWHDDEDTWELVLPFRFPFYERCFQRVYVSSNGFLDFAPGEPEPYADRHYLRAELRVAPLWDDLYTDGTGQDIYVDTSTSGQVRVRWDAKTYVGNHQVNVAVVLFDDGRIRFDYGSGNTGIAPVVGFSRGIAGRHEFVAGYDGASNLGNANSILYTLQGSDMPPGLSLSAAGVLSGTPTTPGTYEPWVRVTDAQHRYDETQLTLTVGITDCNNNSVDDALDISNGTSDDCNVNGIPDECEPDCDADGVPDDCETDCNANGTPDDCESFPDCNSNGIPDECEPDCDADGIPDDCEVDCNANGTPDDCESFPDCNSNGIPDECEPDCDADGIPDDCEVDCNANGTPDDCESFPDCNSNGVPDECDIAGGAATDLDGNGVPDSCQMLSVCHAKPNSAGCLPAIASTGLPTLSGPDDFVVTASDVVGGAPGVLVWSMRTNGAFGGKWTPIGGSPLGGRGCLFGAQALGSQTAGGSPGTCGGTYAFPVTQADMAGAGMAAGMTAYAQIWYADPGHPDGSGVGHTDALAFPVLP